MRFFEPRSSPPPHCGGLQLALRSFASSAVGEPHPATEKLHQMTKKARKLLYDSIIRTTFGASDPSKNVNRIAVSVNVGNLL